MLKDRNICCLNQISPAGTARFRKGYTLVDTMEHAQGVMVRSADMHDMKFPAELRAIARAGAGVNNIPLERCAEEGIVVFNTPGANANAVKELVIAGLMLASRDITGGFCWVKDHADAADIKKAAEKAKKAFAGREISGKTLGVIGLGAIGVNVANTAIQLGMDVIGYDPYVSIDSAWDLDRHVAYARDLDMLYEKSDYITIHVPFMAATKHMVDRAGIAKMKDGVRFLNFARDELVDEAAMAEALASRHVAAYVSDFPNPVSAKMEHAVILPHLGASTEEAEDNCAMMAAEELQDYLDNGNIRHSVNYPDLDAGVCTAAARVAILHRNNPNMNSQITSFFGKNGLNIESLHSKSKGAYEYTLLDLDEPMPRDTVERLREIGGVLRVRRVVTND